MSTAATTRTALIHLLWIGETLTGAYSSHDRAWEECDQLTAQGIKGVHVIACPLDEQPIL